MESSSDLKQNNTILKKAVLKPVWLGRSVLCRIALWDCFGDTDTSFIANYVVQRENESKFAN